MTIRYRPEIDGLRALAVSSVVLFHASIPGFSGGFVGVDIFFVISGFLITSIIYDQWLTGRFSYSVFLERRIRRILPPLAVVMLAATPFAYALMLPDPLENFGQSVVATALSANNILLWLTSGYWDLASEFKPLLHTWSLGVEEQYYLIYPFALIFALRLAPKPRLALLGVVAVLSYVAMVRVAPMDPSAAFYLLPFRAWQLLIGGIAALAVRDFALRPQPYLAALGTALMVATVLGNGLTETHLSLSLLIATIGAVLFLAFADTHAWSAWPFTRPSVVFVGLISYSFYLWHQPVFAFTRIAMFDEPGMLQYVAGIVLAFGLAVLSYRYVEQPFRSPASTGRRLVFGTVGGSMGLLIALGLVINSTNGLPERLETASGTTSEAGSTIAYNERIRSRLSVDFKSVPDGRLRVAVLGNSFARDFANVLLETGIEDTADLVYRDDLPSCPQRWDANSRRLIDAADLVVFASGAYSFACFDALNTTYNARPDAPEFWYVGPKHFGANLNPLVRMSAEERSEVRLKVPVATLRLNSEQAARLGDNYVNLLAFLAKDGEHIRVADGNGALLTTDRVHLSPAGAAYLAANLAVLAPQFYARLAAGPTPPNQR